MFVCVDLSARRPRGRTCRRTGNGTAASRLSRRIFAVFRCLQLSGTTCLTPLVKCGLVLCVFCRVKDHDILSYYLSGLKNVCQTVRQVVSEKWFPLIQVAYTSETRRRRVARGGFVGTGLPPSTSGVCVCSLATYGGSPPQL